SGVSMRSAWRSVCRVSSRRDILAVHPCQRGPYIGFESPPALHVARLAEMIRARVHPSNSLRFASRRKRVLETLAQLERAYDSRCAPGDAGPEAAEVSAYRRRQAGEIAGTPCALTCQALCDPEVIIS